MNLHTESGLFYQLWVWLSGILAGQHCFVILHDSDYALLPLKSKTNYDGMAAGLPPPPSFVSGCALLRDYSACWSDQLNLLQASFSGGKRSFSGDHVKVAGINTQY